MNDRHSPKWELVVAVVAIVIVLALSSGVLLSLDAGVLVAIIYYSPLVGVAIACLVSYEAGRISGQLEATTAALFYELATTGAIAENLGDTIRVRLSRSVSASIRLKGSNRTWVVSYGMELSQHGFFWIIVLGLTLPFLALLLTLLFLMKVNSFGNDKLMVVLPRASASTEHHRREDVRELLVECLSEARRVSLEAHEVLRSDYEDMITLSFVAGLLTLASVLIAVPSHYLDDPLSALVLMLSLFAAVTGLLALSARKRFKPRMNEVTKWNNLLSHALEAERLPVNDDVSSDSAFELLARATREMPGWLEIRRRSMLAREPIWSMVVFLSVSFGFFLTLGGVLRMGTTSSHGVEVAVVGAALLLGGLMVYFLSEKRRREEASFLRERWAQRSRKIDQQLEQVFGECQ